MEQWFCPNCGAANENRFCTSCGTGKPEFAAQPAEPEKVAAPLDSTAPIDAVETSQAVEPEPEQSAAPADYTEPMQPAAPIIPVDEPIEQQYAPQQGYQQDNGQNYAPQQSYQQDNGQNYAGEQYYQPVDAQQYYDPAQTAYQAAPAAEQKPKKKFPVGAIIGIVGGVIVAAILAVILIYRGTPTGVELDNYSLKMKVGEEKDITATVHRFLAADTVNDVDWDMSAKNIITVEDGVVTAVDEGKLTLTAVIEDVTAECSVTTEWPTVELGGTSYKINATELDLSGSSVTDLTPLTAMIQLESLDLSNTPVTDVSVLASIPTLKTVTLTGSGVTDVSSIVDKMNIVYLGLSSELMLDFGEAYTATADDFGLNVGGARINWTCDYTDIADVSGNTITATAVQNDISSFSGDCTIHGTVEGTDIELIYYTEVAANAKSYRTYWSDDADKFTTGSIKWTVYPLHIEPTVENAWGITFKYTVFKGSSGDPAKKDFVVRVKTTDGKWEKVGAIPVEYDVWKTATIMFEEPISFTKLVILPAMAASWGDNYTLEAIWFAPDGQLPM